LREDDLPQMLRSFATSCNQLPKEEVRSFEQPAPKEEIEVNVFSLPR